jgi:hypothetical protein
MVSYSSGEGGSGSRINAIRGAIVVALLNRLDAVVASARTSVSAVAEPGVGVSSGTNRGEIVATRALVSEVLQKKDGEKPASNIIPTGMQIMCWSTVDKAGDLSGWYMTRWKAALMLSLYRSRSRSGCLRRRHQI